MASPIVASRSSTSTPAGFSKTRCSHSGCGRETRESRRSERTKAASRIAEHRVSESDPKHASTYASSRTQSEWDVLSGMRRNGYQCRRCGEGMLSLQELQDNSLDKLSIGTIVSFVRDAIIRKMDVEILIVTNTCCTWSVRCSTGNGRAPAVNHKEARRSLILTRPTSHGRTPMEELTDDEAWSLGSRRSSDECYYGRLPRLLGRTESTYGEPI